MDQLDQPTPQETQVQILAYVTSENELEVSKNVWKKLHGTFVLIPYPFFFFFPPNLAIRKKWFNASPWTYCILPTQERAVDTSSLSLSPSSYLNLLHAKQNYLYRETKCRSTKCLCKQSVEWYSTVSGIIQAHVERL